VASRQTSRGPGPQRRDHSKGLRKQAQIRSLNAFVDYHNPFDIIKHLMIGSEGTLAFISDITYNTVINYKYKACTLMIFETIEKACFAVPFLKESPVAAVELLDRNSIRSIENDEQAPDYFK
jgi:D-lactate dehydrogenase